MPTALRGVADSADVERPPAAASRPPPPAASSAPRPENEPDGEEHGRRTRRSRGAPRRRRRRLIVIAVGVLAVALAAAGTYVYLSREPQTAATDAVPLRRLATPFEVAGVRFDISRTLAAPWVSAVRKRTLPAGRAWMTLTADVTNVSRAGFRLRELDYRVRTRSGLVVNPSRATLRSTNATTARPLPLGTRANVRLAFAVPRTERDVWLEFQPGSGSDEVRIALR